MKGICYRNTATNLPGWIEQLHESQPYGFAYELPNHFVHLYGASDPYYIISHGLTVIEAKSGSLEDWARGVFGAQNIQPLANDIGHTVAGVWRPGLLYQTEIYEGLNIDKYDHRFCEQSLRGLIEQLDDLLLYIEPEGSGLNAYSHKTRDLLILACTEVETHWKELITMAGAAPQNGRMYTTNDYSRLIGATYIKEFSIKLRNYRNAPDISPFGSWVGSAPTSSLNWYDAYNKTKHDRTANFSMATLDNAIHAICGCIVLFCVRFGPFNLLNESKALSSIFNQIFEVKLTQPDITSFYVPLYEFAADTRTDRFVFDPYREKLNKPWVPEQLAL